jgi:hypothetical protein
MADRFECVLAALLHEDPLVVPQTIGFTNDMARAKFVPSVKGGLGEAEFLDKFFVGAGDGGFRVIRTVEAGPRWSLAEWETGAVWRRGTAENMWAREYEVSR